MGILKGMSYRSVTAKIFITDFFSITCNVIELSLNRKHQKIGEKTFFP